MKFQVLVLATILACMSGATKVTQLTESAIAEQLLSNMGFETLPEISKVILLIYDRWRGIARFF